MTSFSNGVYPENVTDGEALAIDVPMDDTTHGSVRVGVTLFAVAVTAALPTLTLTVCLVATHSGLRRTGLQGRGRSRMCIPASDQ
jgi:hypothetical protein